MTGIERWLEDARAQQIETFGVDPTTLTGDALADFVRLNALATTGELHELLNTIQWKTWKADQGEALETRQEQLAELVDVMAFVANIALALGFTSTQEVSSMIRHKQAVVRERQANSGNAYRMAFFTAAGAGPWPCFFCDEPVGREVVVHHVDHNRTNNDVSNLVPAHEGCHTSYHVAARWDALKENGPWTCEECDREFSTLQGLTWHVKFNGAHGGEAPAKGKKMRSRRPGGECDGCGFSFATSRSLSAHHRFCGDEWRAAVARADEIIESWRSGLAVTTIARLLYVKRTYVVKILEAALGERPENRHKNQHTVLETNDA